MNDCRLQDLSTVYPQSYPQPNTGQIYFLIRRWTRTHTPPTQTQ